MKVIGNLHILGQRSIIKMNAEPSSNFEYSGWVAEVIVQENVQKGQLLCYDSQTQAYKLAKADSEDTMPARAMAVEDIEAGQMGMVLLNGTIKINDDNYTTPYIYVSPDVAGGKVLNEPAAIGNIVQKIATPTKNNTAWYDFATNTKTIQA